MKYLLISLALLIFCGCRSAENAFEDGRQAEMLGQDVQAMSYYMESLRLDEKFLDSRERLIFVGSKIIDKEIGKAEKAIQNDQGRQALSFLDKAEARQRGLAAYVSQVRLPNSFEALRTKARYLAIENVFKRSEKARRQKTWAESLSILASLEELNPNNELKQRATDLEHVIRVEALDYYLLEIKNNVERKKWSQSHRSLSQAEVYLRSPEDRKQWNNWKDQIFKELYKEHYALAAQAFRAMDWTGAEKSMSYAEGFALSSAEKIALSQLREEVKQSVFEEEIRGLELLADKAEWSKVFERLEALEKVENNVKRLQRLTELNTDYQVRIINSSKNDLERLSQKKEFEQALGIISQVAALSQYLQKENKELMRAMTLQLSLDWSTHLFNEGKYRASWLKAKSLLDSYPDHELAQDLVIKAERLGRKDLVLLPLRARTEDMSLVEEIEVAFSSGPARNLPVFLGLISNQRVARAMRDQRLELQNLSPRQAAQLGRATGAPFVLMRELSKGKVTKEENSSRQIKVRRKDKSMSSYQLSKGHLVFKSSLLFSLIDSATGQSILNEELLLEERVAYQEATSRDIPNDLILNHEQRLCFRDPLTDDIVHELEHGAALKAADFFTKKLIPKIEAQVP